MPALRVTFAAGWWPLGRRPSGISRSHSRCRGACRRRDGAGADRDRHADRYGPRPGRGSAAIAARARCRATPRRCGPMRWRPAIVAIPVRFAPPPIDGTPA